MKVPSLMIVLAALALGGCQTTSQPGNESSLYEALGERSGIQAFVEDLLYRIADDDRINHQFRGVDVMQFVTNFTDQLCEVSGGPCTYSGQAMREGHQSMNITDTQFNAVAENLILAMEANDVSTQAQNRLLKRLVPMYPDIRNL